ncbi:hypothetical protein AVEN_56346-1 [Araneus ventricosus]|uniref:Uncharacterized protein n=2 Tax=Araneus ventricosus TaxID=182803 RepID=A0A4Y2VRP2_ARAVE|nr:hypothetical protein AVEN_56346-1 [Araneus ventricosus]
MLGHSLCTNFAITKRFVDYVMHSSFAYRQFNSNFTCGDSTILLYELIHSRNRGTVDHNVRLPRSRQLSGWVACTTQHEEVWNPTHDLTCAILTDTADLQWNRVWNLEPSDPEAETLLIGHRDLRRGASLRNRVLCIEIVGNSLANPSYVKHSV